MESKLKPCLSLPLPPKTLEQVTRDAKDWAILHGIGMRSKQNFSSDGIIFTPFMLLPTSFPRSEFLKAVKIQTIINEVVNKVAHDYEFLKNTLSSTIQVDEFTGRLFKIYEAVREEGVAQPISLGLLRSDYLLDLPDLQIKQVEVNTISCSFAALGSILSNYHKFILPALGSNSLVQHIPENNALTGYTKGICEAWKLYTEKSAPTAAVLFVVEDVTYNIGDQRLLEFAIQELCPQIRVLRRSLTEIAEQMKLGEERQLLIEDTEIAVIYFRSAYTPEFYHSEKEWDARLLMERSLAIKCPSIHYQLAGAKKIQQELAVPNVLQKFVPSMEDCEILQSAFTGLYSLDMTDPNAEKTIEEAINNPFKYVLKPQREGGGNNLYNEDIRTHLEKIKNSPERNGWTLMEKINPPLQKNYMLRPEQAQPIYTDTISELGIFGVVIGHARGTLVNEQVGHMLRSKVSSSNEGGVSAGSGALDNVILV